MDELRSSACCLKSASLGEIIEVVVSAISSFILVLSVCIQQLRG